MPQYRRRRYAYSTRCTCDRNRDLEFLQTQPPSQAALGIADLESRSLPCLNLKLDCHTRQGAEPRCSTSSRSSNGVQYSQ